MRPAKSLPMPVESSPTPAESSLTPAESSLTPAQSAVMAVQSARDLLARRFRAVAGCVVIAGLVGSVTACGSTHALLGIHEAPKAAASTATTVPLSTDQASRILARVFTAANQGEPATGAAAQAAQQTAYTGEALRVMRARVNLVRAQPRVEAPALKAPQRPDLLAVSRGVGFPRFIVAQTQALKGGPSILHLLTSPDAATPYRISVSAEMVPLAKVTPFGAVSQGSPLVTDGPGPAGLAVAPRGLLAVYAAGMAFPTQVTANPPFAADAFSAQLRARATVGARDVAAQATFAQAHKVVNGSTYAVQQAGGDALVFGVLERTDSFVVRPGQAVNTSANKAFVQLTGRKQVTNAATVTTLEVLVFAVPRSKGPATLVAAREQIVAGSGS